MRGLQGAKASTQKISIEQAVYELVGQRQIIQEQLELPLVEPQLLISTEIMKAALIGGNNEVDVLWARRFGKTETFVQTALTLGVYFAHRLCQNFLIGLVNPAR